MYAFDKVKASNPRSPISHESLKLKVSDNIQILTDMVYQTLGDLKLSVWIFWKSLDRDTFFKNVNIITCRLEETKKRNNSATVVQ